MVDTEDISGQTTVHCIQKYKTHLQFYWIGLESILCQELMVETFVTLRCDATRKESLTVRSVTKVLTVSVSLSEGSEFF